MEASQHYKIISSISQYLNGLRTSVPSDLNVDQNKLPALIQLLEDTIPIPEGSSSSDSTQSLISMFASQPTSSAQSNFQAKLDKYVAILTSKGYFQNHEVGSPEYNTLLERAKLKLLKRSAEGGSGGTSTEQPPTVQVSEEDKKRAEELKNQGNEHLSKNEYDKAVTCYTKAIEIFPTAVYYCNRAAAYSSLSDHQKAIVDSKKAIELDPTYVKGYSRLGLAYFSLERYQEAIDEGYQKALNLSPNSQMIKDSLAAAKAKLASKPTSSTSSTAQDSNPQTGARSGGMPDLSSLMNMFGGGGGGAGAPAGGAPSGTGGLPDLSGILNNPQFMSMAQNLMSNPQFQSLAESFSSTMMGGNQNQNQNQNQ